FFQTNAFCAGGTFLANGDLLAVGGNGPLEWLDPSVTDGFDGIRYLTRSASNPALNGQSWREPGNKLASKRWYPSGRLLQSFSNSSKNLTEIMQFKCWQTAAYSVGCSLTIRVANTLTKIAKFSCSC